MANDEDTENPYASSRAALHDRAEIAADRVSGIWKLSLCTCVLAIIVSVYNILNGAENWGPSFLAGALVFSVVTVFLTGPYVAFGALAWCLRSNHVLSVILLAMIVSISLSAAVALTAETNAYLNRDRSVPGAQRLGPFLIGLAQWASVVVVSAVLIPVFFYMKGLSKNQNAVRRS